MEIFYGTLDASGAVRLALQDAQHCVRVLRHRAGDEIAVMDGSGSLYHCRLLSADPREAVAEILSEESGFGAHPYHLTMAVCPTKNMDRYEWFCEKAVEIGVDAIVPIIGERSERRTLHPERLERLALSAAKQSLKARIPRIADAMPLRDYLAAAPPEALRLMAYCHGERKSLAESLAGMDGKREIHILIGPEGDFSDAEIRDALARGWQPVHLGASRLRTETAAVVAVTAVYLAAPEA